MVPKLTTSRFLCTRRTVADATRHNPSSRTLSSQGHSEPIICDTSPISWQVFSGLEPVVTVNGNLCHILRVGQSQVDPHGTPPPFAGFQASPICNAATCRAEMKHDPLSPCVGLGRTRDVDAPP